MIYVFFSSMSDKRLVVLGADWNTIPAVSIFTFLKGVRPEGRSTAGVYIHLPKALHVRNAQFPGACGGWEALRRRFNGANTHGVWRRTLHQYSEYSGVKLAAPQKRLVVVNELYYTMRKFPPSLCAPVGRWWRGELFRGLIISSAGNRHINVDSYYMRLLLYDDIL